MMFGNTFGNYSANARTYRSAIPSIILLLLISSPDFAAAPNLREPNPLLPDYTFRLSINRPQDDPYSKWVTSIYTEVFRRLNIPLQTEFHPLQRASQEANTGRIDGEAARIYEYGDFFPNLVRVEEPVFLMTVVAYTTDPELSGLTGWQSLESFEGYVEYPRGMKLSEFNLPKVVPTDRLSAITYASQGIRRLVAHRIDLYVDDMNAVTPLILNPKYGLQKKVRIAGILAEVPLYMYVHFTHRKLVPQLSDAIKKVKSEGLIELYRREAYNVANSYSE